MGNTLVIRTDANTEIGSGHLMRCLALGQAWKDAGGEVVFVTACSSERLLQRIYGEDFMVQKLEPFCSAKQDWQVVEDLLAEHRDAWLVLDGYHFDSDYQRRVKEAGYRLMVIDDTAHLPHYYVDIVLNQNIHAKSLCYSYEPYTQLLLGTQYVLLGREFLKWRGWKRENSEIARKVLVTLGGSDPENVTLKVLQALQHLEIDGVEALVVVGGGNPHYEEVQSAVRASRLPMRLDSNVTNMPDLMAWADVAVSAGGSTCWELAFMGVSSLIIPWASNQLPVAAALDDMGVFFNLGWYGDISADLIAQEVSRLLLTPEIRAEITRRGQNLVDGNGAIRVLPCLEKRILRLRQVREHDRKLLWEWANDLEVRAGAFSSGPIPWEEHVCWFTHKLHDPNCFLFIGLDDRSTPIGQVRLDMTNDSEAEIGVSIEKSRRGSGYGSLLISKAVEEVFRTTRIRTVHAFIKPGNEGSTRAFEKAKFVRLRIETVKGSTAEHYLRVKEG